MCVARASRALSHLSRPNLLTDLLECVNRLSGDLWPRVLLTCDRKRHPQLTERLNGLVPCVVVLSADAQVPDLHQSCKHLGFVRPPRAGHSSDVHRAPLRGRPSAGERFGFSRYAEVSTAPDT